MAVSHEHILLIHVRSDIEKKMREKVNLAFDRITLVAFDNSMLLLALKGCSYSLFSEFGV